MQLKNNENNYGAIAKLFHWLMALLILGMLAIGLTMVTLPNGLDKLQIYGWHKSTGIVILFLVFLRLTWRQFNYQPKTPESKTFPPHAFKLMEFAANTTHIMIYFLMFAMPLTGWAMSSAYGFPVSVYGLYILPNLVAPDKVFAKTLENIHDYGAYLLIALLITHIGAALFHHFILKDVVLKRMLPVIILIIMPLVANAKAPLYEINKTKSSIKFEAIQNGAPASGEFKDFRGSIYFAPVGSKCIEECSAIIEIKMDSVFSTYDEMVSTLKAPDWFNVKNFPVAKFETKEFIYALSGELPFKGGDYRINGNLTIIGKTQPVSLLCQIKLSEDNVGLAIADCKTTIMRRDFGLGWKDTDTVKDEVKVIVHIEATTNK